MTTTDTGRLPGATPSIKRTITIATVITLAAAIVLAILGWRAGIFTSLEALRAYLDGWGIWAPLAFIVIQVIQIIIPIIPGAITLSVGVLAFGPVQGFFLNYFSIVLGSFLAFYLGRWFGQPLIRSITPEKAYAKYSQWLDQGQTKFDKLFALAIFLPGAPDDLLCMLAGVSRMSAKKCLLMLIICKPLFLIPYSLGIEGLTGLLGM